MIRVTPGLSIPIGQYSHYKIVTSSNMGRKMPATPGRRPEMSADHGETMVRRADALDAAVFALAGPDFARGR